MTTKRGDSHCMEQECCGCGPEVEFGDRRLDPIELAVRAAGFRLLLDSGQPASIASIAGAEVVDPTATTHVLEGFARTGNVSIDGDQVMTIAGSLSPPPAFGSSLRRVDGGPDVLDAVGIMGALGAGVIYSQTTLG